MLFQNQGDEGPVIAKRVVQDRSASAEAPAPAEHCIVVKQASGGGGEQCSACLVAYTMSAFCSHWNRA